MNSTTNDEIQQNSDNDLLSDISAYNSDDDTETIKKVINPVFNEINSLLNNLQMEAIQTNDGNNKNTNEHNTDTDQNNNPESSTTIGVKLRKKNRNNSNRDKLDSVRYSMYTLQNSQVNDIDSLLEELCEYENTLSQIPAFNLNFMNSQSNNEGIKRAKPLQNDHIDDSRNISKQFDDVLKLISDSIDEPLNITINKDHIDSQYTSSINSSPKSQENISSSCSTSSSSGIIEDENLKINKISEQQQKHLQQEQHSIYNNIPTNTSILQQKENVNIKRNSSDSAFSDSISSSQSISTLMTSSMGLQTSNNKNTVVNMRNPAVQAASDNSELLNLTPQEKAEMEKAEKIRIALEKIKEANIKKLIVKAYTDDGCTKSILIDETMKTYDIMITLLLKTHTLPTIKHSVVECLPKMFMERIIEDHENLVEIMSNWTRDSENQIIFTEKVDKYDLFQRPEMYLTNESYGRIDETKRSNILNEFFQNLGSPVPEVEGFLHIKSESKKSWKKYYCILRQSGLYCIPKGKNKKDIQSLFNFDKLDLYRGFDWKKEFKAPTDYCFGLKYPQIQKISPKYMKYICCETERDYKRWMAGIRLVKFGRQLYENYKKIIELEELSKISGFLLLANNRRTSANLSNIQRPKSNFSNYSVNSVLLERSNSVASSMMQQQPKQQMNEVYDNKSKDYYDEESSNTDTLRHKFTDDIDHINFRSNLTSKILNQNQSNVPIKTNNEATSLLNMLKPARRSQSSVSSITNPFSTLQKQAKLPVNTGITKQMLTSNELNSQPSKIEEPIVENKYIFEQEQQASVPRFLNLTVEKTDNQISPIKIKTTNRSFSTGSSTQDSNNFDFPSPPAELLEPPFQEQQLLQTNSPLPSPPVTPSTDVNVFTNRLSKGYAPIAPKPAFQVTNLNRSISNCSSYRQNFDSINSTDSSCSRRISNVSISSSKPLSSLNNANTNSNPQLLDELSAKLARQRKLIEIDENIKNQANDNGKSSPKLQKKPPPPPRSDSIRVASSSFLKAGNYC